MKSNKTIRAEGIRKLKYEPGLTSSEKLVIQEILEYDFSGKNGYSHPSQAKIASDLNLSVDTVKRAVRQAKNMGLFHVQQIRTGNAIYHIDYKTLDKLNREWDKFAALEWDSRKSERSGDRDSLRD